ncbi:60S ribosomal protein L26 [Pseudoloma neurophilia]|uniref:60S ribosomal protein L26 n=1 Tax=Pseudoloma neurophilia TaxID=146866 RepID=A0A0R0M3C8_9MICR|nr:60S ribosomal protein L26 [Pseudoloma neurophilia]
MKFNKNVTSSRRKQRKAHFTAQGTELTKQFTAQLSKPLQEEFSIKRIPIRPNDRVKILVGKFKARDGKVVRVNRHARKICIEDCTITKKDGGIKYIGVHPSNVRIIGLSMEKDRPKLLKALQKKIKAE